MLAAGNEPEPTAHLHEPRLPDETPPPHVADEEVLDRPIEPTVPGMFMDSKLENESTLPRSLYNEPATIVQPNFTSAPGTVVSESK